MAVDHPQFRVAATEEVVQFAGGRVQAIEIAQAVGARAAHAAGLDFGKTVVVDVHEPDIPRRFLHRVGVQRQPALEPITARSGMGHFEAGHRVGTVLAGGHAADRQAQARAIRLHHVLFARLAGGRVLVGEGPRDRAQREQRQQRRGHQQTAALRQTDARLHDARLRPKRARSAGQLVISTSPTDSTMPPQA